jgi:hypothetical protein
MSDTYGHLGAKSNAIVKGCGKASGVAISRGNGSANSNAVSTGGLIIFKIELPSDKWINYYSFLDRRIFIPRSNIW